MKIRQPLTFIVLTNCFKSVKSEDFNIGMGT